MPTTQLKLPTILPQSISQSWALACERETKRLDRSPPLAIKSRGLTLSTSLNDLPDLLADQKRLSITLPNRLKVDITKVRGSNDRFSVHTYGHFERYQTHGIPSGLGGGGIFVEHLGKEPQGKHFEAQITAPLCFTFDCQSRNVIGDGQHNTLTPLTAKQAVSATRAIAAHQYKAPPEHPSITRRVLDTASICLGF